jgi:dimethylhistidine N-methyltransferase
MPGQVQFYDYKPPQQGLGQAVVEGLTRARRAIPPKYFYDTRGSELFEQICEQPEYYVPDAEREILTRHAGELTELIGPGALLIEPGAGASRKVRLFLDRLRPSAYLPMDISGDFLLDSARALAMEYPWLEIHAACVDYVHHLEIPEGLPDHHRVAFFPGSSLGNFEPEDAVGFLRKVADAVGVGGGLLIGIDMKKDKAVLDAAYNDRQGVTAAFNRNLLVRINRELGADFEPERFEHRAFYNEAAGRVEMHLVSRCAQRVRLNGGVFEFAAGEGIHTESSYKYTPREFRALAVRAGFAPLSCWMDSRSLFSVHYLVHAPMGPDGPAGAQPQPSGL